MVYWVMCESDTSTNSPGYATVVQNSRQPLTGLRDSGLDIVRVFGPYPRSKAQIVADEWNEIADSGPVTDAVGPGVPVPLGIFGRIASFCYARADQETY